jgi:hypothetical protein
LTIQAVNLLKQIGIDIFTADAFNHSTAEPLVKKKIEQPGKPAQANAAVIGIRKGNPEALFCHGS